jgi:DNA-binding NarL/FixJ family response regulator
VFDPNVVIIALTMYNDPEIIKKAKLAGANAYLLKDVPTETLIDFIFNTSPRKFVLQPGLSQPTNGSEFNSPFVNNMKLTKREKQIINLILESKTTQEIANELKLSPSTIETHRRNIYIKLEVKNVKELIKLSLNNTLS